jgi:hypothetical protein
MATCEVCGSYEQVYINRFANRFAYEVCEKCFSPSEEDLSDLENSGTYKKIIQRDEDYDFWLKIDWEKQSGIIEINDDLKINCFDSQISRSINSDEGVFPPTSSVFFKDKKIGELGWFQPVNQRLGWNLTQNYDWMTVGIGFLTELQWSGNHEKIRDRVRLLIRQDKNSDILHSGIVSLNQESANVGRLGITPSSWNEIDIFAQTDLRRLIVEEGGRIGNDAKSSLKSVRKTVFYDTESLRVPLVMFSAMMLLKFLNLEGMYSKNEGGSA